MAPGRDSVEDCGSTLNQHWVNATFLRKVYRKHSDGLVLGQSRRRLTGIEQAMGYDAGPTLIQNSVGGPISSVRGSLHRRQVLDVCWPATAIVVEGIHVDNIFEFDSD